ncbi:MAG TPA: hypothetical protein VMG10_27390 [Gemmataceae bacterium]|nr:hypothetical protein [Gemmataceae bacterium]
MPNYDAYGVAIWPGVESFEHCIYTCSHGMSPGVAILRMQPQDAPPDEFGDLTLTDGNETVIVPDCKVQSLKVEMDDHGFYWLVEILDRRWRWKDLGWINGCFNQLAPLGNQHLIPWAIRSPSELAELCLAAMGETDYVLQLPPGIDYPGAFYPTYIINVSGVNPPVNWEGIPPAQALQQIADRCGCRIIYQLSTDSILIAPVGNGNPLPPGSIAKNLPSITTPKAPSGVGVIGAPTRYQGRFALTAVGKEWDGSYWPINLLSYAPLVVTVATSQKTKIAPKNPEGGIDWTVELLDSNGDSLATISYSSADGDSGFTISTALADAINANPVFQKAGITATVNAGGYLVLTGQPGVPFFVNVSWTNVGGGTPEPPLPDLTQEMLQAAQGGSSRVSWENSMPPIFPNVRATDRLTQADAQRLARESVFRCYQLTGVDVSGQGTPNIPGYGQVKRTQQIVLTDSQIDLITPAVQGNVVLSNPVVIPPDAPNAQDVKIPLTVNYYNGFASEKPAAVYGQIAYELEWDNIKFLDANGKDMPLSNTPPGSQVLFPFETLPDLFMIRFGSPVYYRLGASDNGYVQIPNLTLQTAVLVRDPLNNQVITFTKIQALNGGDPDAPPAMRHYPDVQLNVTSSYDVNNKLLSWSILENDPLVRADYYLTAMANEYQYKAGQTVEYNGIRALDCDGLTWQVTWECAGRCSTIVSQNAEHSIWVPPYPARRRAEYLPPVTKVNANGERVNMVAPARGFMRGPPGGVFPHG